MCSWTIRLAVRILIIIILGSFILPGFILIDYPELVEPVKKIRSGTGELMMGVAQLIEKMPWEKMVAFIAIVVWPKVREWMRIERLKVR